MRARRQPKERRVSVSPTRAMWRKPKVVRRMKVESQAVRRLCVRASQLWRSVTRAMPESAEPRRAVNSDMPKSL
jgi:hypothetical protein